MSSTGNHDVDALNQVRRRECCWSWSPSAFPLAPLLCCFRCSEDTRQTVLFFRPLHTAAPPLKTTTSTAQELDEFFGVQHAAGAAASSPSGGFPLPQNAPSTSASSRSSSSPHEQRQRPTPTAASPTLSGASPALQDAISDLSQQLARLRSQLSTLPTGPPPLTTVTAAVATTAAAASAAAAASSIPNADLSSIGHLKSNSQPPDLLTHVDQSGRASMVDVAGKGASVREARASCRVLLGPQAFELVQVRQNDEDGVMRGGGLGWD